MVHVEDTYTIEEMREIIKSACDTGESSDDESDEEENDPTICTDDCACDKHSKKTPTVVKRDEHGNYNVIIVPVIENDDACDDDASTVSLGGCDTDFMEDEGEWGLDETYYYIYTGCVLVPEGEDIEDYAQGDGSYANKEEDPVSVFDTICR
jgi:hypothetical protein